MSDVFRLDGVANIPIKIGKPVVCIILEHQVTQLDPHHQTIHPDDFYRPMGLPIFGRMNEFCGLDNIEYHPQMEEKLKSQSLYIKDGYDIVPYKWVSMEDFMRQLKRNDLYYETSSLYPKAEKRIVPLEYVLIHRELYDKLLRHMSHRRPYGEKKNCATLIDIKIREVLDYMTTARQNLEADNAALDKMDFEDDGYFHLLNRVVQVERMRFYSLYSGDEHATHGTDYFINAYLETKDEALLSAVRNALLWDMIMTHTQTGYFCNPSNCMEMIDHQMMAIIHRFAISVVGKRPDPDAYDWRADLYIRPFHAPNTP